LDITRMLADVIGQDNGVSRDSIETEWYRVQAVIQGLEAKRKAGDLPFYDLPDDVETVQRIEDYASNARNRFKNIVVLGIGGSSLGAIALRESLIPFSNSFLPDKTENGLRLFVPDNPDPEYLGAIMDLCPPEETLYNVVTKSGGTAETIAAYLTILTPLKKALKDKYHEHLVFTTDPNKGSLRQIARTESVSTFSIPQGVGGRFSVLTSVGLLPAALMGIDIRRLLNGAANQRENVFNDNFERNPSAAFALLQYLSDKRHDQRIHVMMPYANALYRIADWFRQLWAESLGKRRNLQGDDIWAGPTPIAALGATDQHSQVQLYIEGPNDKTFTFLIPKSFRRELKIGVHHRDIDSMSYLAGKNLGTLLLAEAEATQRALTAAHRPNMAFILEEISPEIIGGLMYLLEAATVVAGGLYGVNPLDQPGVEDGKIATYALMGREGYEDIRAEIEKERNRKPFIIH